MKKIIYLLLSVSLLSCSLDDTTSTQRSGKWSLINVSGGISGTEIIIPSDQITWVFDDINGILIVEENVEGVSYGLNEGTYDYSIENIANADFLFVDEVEYGSITIASNAFSIDQNITSTGTMADGFVYKFRR